MWERERCSIFWHKSSKCTKLEQTCNQYVVSKFLSDLSRWFSFVSLFFSSRVPIPSVLRNLEDVNIYGQNTLATTKEGKYRGRGGNRRISWIIYRWNVNRDLRVKYWCTLLFLPAISETCYNMQITHIEIRE